MTLAAREALWIKGPAGDPVSVTAATPLPGRPGDLLYAPRRPVPAGDFGGCILRRGPDCDARHVQRRARGHPHDRSARLPVGTRRVTCPDPARCRTTNREPYNDALRRRGSQLIRLNKDMVWLATKGG